jgi:hypothetical protein
MVFKKNANFLAENWEKSQKIVIITSTPDFRGKAFLEDKFYLERYVRDVTARPCNKVGNG